jgi:beta-phosphoglucomutase family hydrolase
MSLTRLRGVIFDLDGVITRTARVHALAWEEMFNEFLRTHSERTNQPFKPFDPKNDYLSFVDGKPRFEGVLSFLESRNIKLPYGDQDDEPGTETVHGLGNRKNMLFHEILREEGPEVIESTIDFIHELKKRGVHVAVASSSRNCALVLKLAGLEDLFETRVDGIVSRDLNLRGKPNPDIFVTAARMMGLWPGECVVVEDAISGVRAGKEGNFGLTIGIARESDGQLLRIFGADMVLHDLSEIGLRDLDEWFDQGIEKDGWNLVYQGFDPGDEKLRETLTTIGNGYLGTRGCFEGERASYFFYPGTYIAGMFNKVPSIVEDRTIYNNDFVNCPNWLPIEFRIGLGEYVSPLSMEVLSYRHTLDMREGVMERTIVSKDNLGRITRIASRRFASMDNPHLCVLMYELTPLNYSAPVTFRSSLDGNIRNQGVPRYRQLTSEHLEHVGGGKSGDGIFLHVQTTASKYQIYMCAKTSLSEEGERIVPKKQILLNGMEISEEIRIDVRENRTYRLDKLVSVYTSLDQLKGKRRSFQRAAKDDLATVSSMRTLYAQHVRAWKQLWHKAYVRVTGDRFVQKVIRLHIYHLLVTASPHNRLLDAGMPARGLHGEAYRGHIFWDELYILPFYFSHFPEIARSLLLYRYRRLYAARVYALENGYKGAMYPWQTADDGFEETQEVHYNPESKSWGPDLSRRQRHVSIAVFYNAWRYVFSSEDEQFLKEYGAEMMLDIAKFWSSISSYDERTGKYHISGVMGPDEFHEKLPDTEEPGLTDNAYTNVMVVWLLEKSLELIDRLPTDVLSRIMEKIGVDKEELERWQDMAHRMNVPITPEGIISQFEGYMDLEELDWESYRKRYYSIHRMDRILKAEGDTPDRYKVAKQADVLMMFYVLHPERVRETLNHLGHEVGSAFDLLSNNYNYYEPRTSHGSTLSKVVHAAVSSYIHVDERPWNWFIEALKSDIYDTQGGTTQEGIHTGVMAGTYDIMVRCFARIDLLGEVVEINPRLPEHWTYVALRLCHKGLWYFIEIDKKTVKVTLEGKGAGKVPVRVLGKSLDLEFGEERRVRLSEVAAERWLGHQLQVVEE